MKLALRIFGLTGVLVFGGFFALTFGAPGFVEDAAKDFIAKQVEKEVNQKLEAADKAIQNKTLGKLAEKLLNKNSDEISAIQENLKAGLHTMIAQSIAEMRDLSCECRKKYENFIKSGMQFQILSLEKANEQLQDFTKGKYMQVVKNLTADVRLVSGSNVVLFMLLLLISFLKPRAITHLFLPGILLLVSTLVCTYFYVFEQNWFFTIIYNDYVGLGYLVYVGVLFLILCDIGLNKGRITARILNGTFNIVGAEISVVPC